MTHPQRNVLIYADGRVQEHPERLTGHHYMQDEKWADGTLFRRSFEGHVARSCEASKPEAFTMVYTECRGPSFDEPLPNGFVIVAGVPSAIPAASIIQGRSAMQIHLECIRNGGHRFGDYRNACYACDLDGMVVEMLKGRGNEDQKLVSEYRDTLGTLRSENATLKIENSDLRRRVELLERKLK